MKVAPWLSLLLLVWAVPGLAQEPKTPEGEVKAADSTQEDAKQPAASEKRQQQIRKAEQEIQAAQRTIQKAQRDAQQEVQRALRQAQVGKSIPRGVLLQRGAGPQRILKFRADNPDGKQLFDVYGLELAEADAVLRSQLALKDDQGLVIVRVAEKGLADQAGVKLNDVLIKLNDQPVGKVDEVKVILAKLGKRSAQADLIREGKPRHLSLVGPAHGMPEPATTYWIGVPVAPVDAMLRSQLPALPADSGLIATDVIAESPAAKAGMQKNDIMFKFNDKLIANQEALVEQVQKSNGKESKVELLRGGSSQFLTLKPQPRSGEPQTVGKLDLDFALDEEVVPGNLSAVGRNLFEVMKQEKTNPIVRPPGQSISLNGHTYTFSNTQDGLAGRPFQVGELAPTLVPKVDAQLEPAMKALTGQIEELRKAIDDLKKSLPAGKDLKAGN